jgi:hypothetical protein
MKFTFLILISLTVTFLCNAQSITQEVIANGGGFQKQINGSLQYTVGEPIIETTKNISNILTQGFQQGNYNIVGIKENNPDQINCQVYPNPSPNLINLKIEDSNISNQYKLIIMDVLGKEIKSIYLNDDKIIQYDLSNLAASTYFINITGTNNPFSKTLKIEKINQ